MELEITINLDNYENIKIKVNGDTHTECIDQFKTIFPLLGNQSEHVYSKISSYAKRVFNIDLPKYTIKPVPPHQNIPERIPITQITVGNCENCNTPITKAEKDLSTLFQNKSLCKNCLKS
ncbi:hypothetical protein [Bacteroides sp.]|uniref:hypothetical protein n=1 Tax=Bacteroides sp. TaxID=29523 RepID=UPI00260D73CD|nr:hypothetical protein [Bacteroides sp.]MDD3040703.1 hypothetical protein [Bacteroides sp.]